MISYLHPPLPPARVHDHTLTQDTMNPAKQHSQDECHLQCPHLGTSLAWPVKNCLERRTHKTSHIWILHILDNSWMVSAFTRSNGNGAICSNVTIATLSKPSLTVAEEPSSITDCSKAFPCRRRNIQKNATYTQNYTNTELVSVSYLSNILNISPCFWTRVGGPRTMLAVK